jgi:hypothetical protein
MVLALAGLSTTTTFMQALGRRARKDAGKGGKVGARVALCQRASQKRTFTTESELYTYTSVEAARESPMRATSRIDAASQSVLEYIEEMLAELATLAESVQERKLGASIRLVAIEAAQAGPDEA